MNGPQNPPRLPDASEAFDAHRPVTRAEYETLRVEIGCIRQQLEGHRKLYDQVIEMLKHLSEAQQDLLQTFNENMSELKDNDDPYGLFD